MMKQDRCTRLQLAECQATLVDVQNELQNKECQVNELCHQLERLEDKEQAFHNGLCFAYRILSYIDIFQNKHELI